MELMAGAGAQEPAAQAQRQINQAEQKAKSARPAGRSGKTKIQGDQSGDDMDRVMRRVAGTDVGPQGVKQMSESQDSYQQQNQTQKFTNSLRHGFFFLLRNGQASCGHAQLEKRAAAVELRGMF